MNIIEIISKEEYLKTIPITIHRHIVKELSFQLQVEVEEQLVYCRHIETMAVFMQPNEVTLSKFTFKKRDSLVYILAINLIVMKKLHDNSEYANFKIFLKYQIKHLTSYVESDSLNAAQKLLLKRLQFRLS